MAYTLSGVAGKVRQRIRDTGYSPSETTDYINDTLNDIYNEYRLPFMETSQGYTLASGVSDITNGVGLPTNYVQAIDGLLTTTGLEKVLPFLDIRQIDGYHPDADDTTVHPANVPESLYFYAETIRTYPKPNAAYTLTLRYYKKPTLLSADADVPDLPSEFEELLVVGAAYRILQVKDNYDQAAILQNKYDELLQKLVVRFSQPQVGRPTIMRINRVSLGSPRF